MNEERYKKRRSEILAAAFKVFSKKGYHDTNVSDITKKLKMGHGTFYRYFKNKVDIFIHVFDEILLELQEILEKEPPDKTDDLESYFQQIQSIAKMIADVYKKDIVAARIYYYEVIGSAPEINEKNEEAANNFCQFAEVYIQNGIDKGFLRPDLNAEVLSKILHASVITALREGLVAPVEQADMIREKWVNTVIGLLRYGIVK